MLSGSLSKPKAAAFWLRPSFYWMLVSGVAENAEQLEAARYFANPFIISGAEVKALLWAPCRDRGAQYVSVKLSPKCRPGFHLASGFSVVVSCHHSGNCR